MAGVVSRHGACMENVPVLQTLRSKLSVRVAVLFLVASLAPLVGVGTLTLSGLETSVRERATLRHYALANSAAATVRDLIDSGVEKLTTLSALLVDELPDLDKPTPANKNPRFNKSLVSGLNRLIEPPDAAQSIFDGR